MLPLMRSRTSLSASCIIEALRSSVTADGWPRFSSASMPTAEQGGARIDLQVMVRTVHGEADIDGHRSGSGRGGRLGAGSAGQSAEGGPRPEKAAPRDWAVAHAETTTARQRALRDGNQRRPH